MMRNLVVALHGSFLAILMVLPAAVFLKTTPSLEITAPHCCSTVKVTRTNHSKCRTTSMYILFDILTHHNDAGGMF